MKTLVHSVFLAAIAVVWFLAGQSYGTLSAEPERVEVPVETVVEVEREYEKTLLLGVDSEGNVVEIEGEPDASIVFLITIKYNLAPMLNEISVYLPFDDDVCGILRLVVPSADYVVTVDRLNGSAIVPSEGDEF